MEKLATILNGMKTRAAADAALLTSADGLVLEAVNDTGIDIESLAAYAASNVMVCERLGEIVAFGAPESVVIFYQGRALVMAPLGPVVAVLVGSKSAQPGNLRLQLRRTMDELSAALQEELQLPNDASPERAAGDPERNGNRSTAPDVIASSINLR